VLLAAERLIRESHPDDPAADIALSHALLRRVAAGELPATARVYRPAPTLAFAKLDKLAPGYDAAVAAAASRGFAPVLRLGGGRAAAYHEGCVVVEVIAPQEGIVSNLEARFAAGSQLLQRALARVGVDSAIGELPGEYCAGSWSVNARGIKLAGPAQRAIRGAALWTAFVAVQRGAELRDVLIDVYAALALDWRPETAGAASDIVPGVRVPDVEAALIAELGTPPQAAAHD
jgi:lipoate-protein ligase A